MSDACHHKEPQIKFAIAMRYVTDAYCLKWFKTNEFVRFHFGCHGNWVTIATRYLADSLKQPPYQILTQYHLREGSYKVKCYSGSLTHWSHKTGNTRSALWFCGPAYTDSLWPSLTPVKSGLAQFDASQNGPANQLGLEHLYQILCSCDS